MRCTLSLAALLALLTPALAVAADETKKGSPPESEKPAPTATDAPAEKLVQLGVVRGVVKEAVGPKGELLLRVKVKYLAPNAKAQEAYVAEYRQLLARQRAIMFNPNPSQRQSQMQQLLKQAEQLRGKQKDLVQVKEKDTDVELQLPEDAKIRLKHLPELFDDKGNIKEYTPAEIKALKGTERLPGYAGTRDNIQAGQKVVVKVAQKAIPGTAPGRPGSKAPPRKTLVPKGKPLALIVLIEEDKK
jgi:hypothetical protein